MTDSILPQCQYCLRKIKSKFILCIPCQLELCLKCFCHGVEGGNHRKTHRYQIEDVGTKTQDLIFKTDSDWNYDEELELINAVGIYKSGNWTDIAAMVQSKSPDECRKHFIANYIDGALGRHLINEISSSRTIATTAPLYDHTGGVSSPVFYEMYPPSLMHADEEKCLGYLPRRNEFLMEYDDGAEKLICAMEPDCGGVGTVVSALHVTLIDMYNLRVAERNRRKRVSLEHCLTYHLIAAVLDKGPRDYNYFHRQLMRRTQPPSVGRVLVSRQRSLFGRNYVQPSIVKNGHRALETKSLPDQTEPRLEERASWHYNPSIIDDTLKPFLQYLSAEDTKHLLESLKAEQSLKTEIGTLQLCVQHGITSFQDYKTKLEAHNKHRVKSPTDRRKTTKRKRGMQRCYQFIYMMRKKRMEKYLDSMKPGDRSSKDTH